MPGKVCPAARPVLLVGAGDCGVLMLDWKDDGCGKRLEDDGQTTNESERGNGQQPAKQPAK